MKKLALVAGVLLVIGLLVYEFGEALTRRHYFKFEWKLSPEKALTLSDSLAVEGIELALRASSRGTAGWQPVPVAPESAASVLRKGQNPNAGLVVLTNSNSTAQLYARVELDVTNRALNVVISRPK